MTKRLRLSEIVTDAGTQVRAGLNETTVTDYAEALAAGAKFPPVIVFHDGNRHIAADGFHRIEAGRRIGATHIECDIRRGGKVDALKFALGCNAHHGLRRTNADKRHAVGMALKEFPKAGIAVIADMCLVSNELVSEIRKTQVADFGDLKPSTRIGKDGKEYRLPPPPMRPSPTIPTAPTSGTDRTNGTNGSTVSAQPVPPPPPTQVLDSTGWPIPTQLIPLWQRTDEVQEMLTALSRVKGALRAAQETKDKLFAEVLFSSALSHLDQAWQDLKTAKPFAVCPTCQGQLPEQCRLCQGRGLISEFRWNTCVTREDKEFRARAKQKAEGRK
jgi:hypothetical protein